MAYDKVIDSSNLDAGMTATANAIREKTGGAEKIPWEAEKGFSSAIALITKDGIDTSDATATADTILDGKTAYVDGKKITGNIPIMGSEGLSVTGYVFNVKSGYYPKDMLRTGNATMQPPFTVISVDANGLITVSVSTMLAFYHSETSTSTKQLSTQVAQTILPGTTDQIIRSGKYLTGDQTIKGDANLVPENIASGVSIFGVEGVAKSVGITDVRIEEVI